MATPIVIRSREDLLQDLAWQALARFVALRRLRRTGIEALGVKCSTVQLEHWQDGTLPSHALEFAMRRLAQGIPGGAIVSVCPFDKPPPDIPEEGEILPQAAAIAVSEIAAMQVLMGYDARISQHIYRFAVTWNPRPPRQRRIAHTPKLN